MTSPCAQPRSPTWFGMEEILLARLAEIVPDGVKVLSVTDIDGAKEASLPKPSVRVIYYGHDIVIDRNATGPRPQGWAQVRQTWLVVPAVRNAHRIREGGASREDASPLVDIVFGALDGWWPEDVSYGQLVSVSPPVQSATLDGCTYVPLAFVNHFRLTDACRS